MNLPPDFTDDQKETAEMRIRFMQEANNLPMDDKPPSEILAIAIQEAIERDRCFFCEQRKCDCKT
jgi:hypothetical protein